MKCLLSEKIKIRSSNINILRFASAIAVVLCHSYAVTQRADDFVAAFNQNQCNLGGVAVAVFFFLSGLYVTKSLEKDSSYVLFLKKRCKRILPQLWIVVIVSVLLGLFLTNLPLVSYLCNKQTYLYLLNGVLIPIHDLPGVFLQNPYQTVNGPLWTLPVEMICYIGLVVIALAGNLLFGSDIKKRRYLDAMAFAVVFAVFLFLQFTEPKGVLISIVRPMVIFFEGVLYYDCRIKIKLNPLLGCVALVGVILLAKTPAFNFGLVFLFPYAVLAIALGLPQFSRDWILFSISYEMYLVGWPIQQLVLCAWGEMTPIRNFFITIPIDIVVGAGVYVLTEWLFSRKVSVK